MASARYIIPIVAVCFWKISPPAHAEELIVTCPIVHKLSSVQTATMLHVAGNKISTKEKTTYIISI